jgi:hypothetical protein
MIGGKARLEEPVWCATLTGALKMGPTQLVFLHQAQRAAYVPLFPLHTGQRAWRHTVDDSMQVISLVSWFAHLATILLAFRVPKPKSLVHGFLKRG